MWGAVLAAGGVAGGEGQGRVVGELELFVRGLAGADVWVSGGGIFGGGGL